MTKPAGTHIASVSDATARAKDAQESAELAARAWHLLGEVALTMRAAWLDVAAEFDLTPAQALALRRLEPNTPLPMNTLADAMLCDASNVTGIVDKLEARGLIERQAIEHDRRVKMLAVTKRGEELRRRLLHRGLRPSPAVAALAPDDHRQLIAILDRLLSTR
ncbi:MAG TPA: MarR family transcriptional regulator [Polyangia bacterium]|nr:MarR family transcriptional regulator [Polyangia bacterium]